MNLTTAVAPYKTTKDLVKKECVKQAHYKNVDTGQTTLVTELDENGLSIQVSKPVYEKTFIPAQFGEKTHVVEIWVVETWHGDVCEKHEFSTEEDAKNFYKGFTQ